MAATANEIVHCGFTREELKAAFDKVADKADWRGPICAVIPAKDWPVTHAAIGFFCATDSNREVVDDHGEWLKVTAVGYRMGPAGP